jgi:NADPH:quinone reductase
MQAAVVREFGPIGTVAVADVPIPVPAAHEVLIRVQAVAANFVDRLVIGGSYQFLPERPFIPGKGPAGVIVAVGPGVTGFAPGDRVLAMAEIGGYAEFAVAPSAQCYRLPDCLAFADAAAMSLAYDTAWLALLERCRFFNGETLFVF